MSGLAEYVATYVAEYLDRYSGQDGGLREVRVVFRGPPLELLEDVFRLLATQARQSGPSALPVLLQVPKARLTTGNPRVGESGWCDHAHLLTVRDTASAPRFVALIPPDEHMDLSVATTVDKFGLSDSACSGSASFEDWWSDPFVIQVVNAGINALGLSADLESARELVELGARAADAIDDHRRARPAAWRLISRIFSAVELELGLSPAARLSAACGFPPSLTGRLRTADQERALSLLGSALEDGFASGLDGALQNATDTETRDAVQQFMAFAQRRCEIASSFATAPAAFYATSTTQSVEAPPDWWTTLTCERWLELLEGGGGEAAVNLRVANALNAVQVGGIAIVRSEAELALSAELGGRESVPIELAFRAAGGRAASWSHVVKASEHEARISVDIPLHRAPVRITGSHDTQQVAAVKVVSLATWEPGVYVQSRTARKVVPTRRRITSGKDDYVLEAGLVLEGPGRHLLDIFVGPQLEISDTATLRGQEDSPAFSESLPCSVHAASEYQYNIEVEVSGACELDIAVAPTVGPGGKRQQEQCRVHVTCIESETGGCASEFERLIRENRGRRKWSVQPDRVARSSVLEAWLLEDANVSKSWVPIALGTDYADVWAQPTWDGQYGPVLSRGRFICDPRPAAAELCPPAAFVSARAEIARWIRGTEGSGLVAQAPLGRWARTEPSFIASVEAYLDAYRAWHQSSPDEACWADVVAIVSLEAGASTLSAEPVAVMLSPLHPARLAWHCVAQACLAAPIDANAHCPAAALIDPDSVPDLLTLALRGPDGVEQRSFVSVESSSDYWAVLWNSTYLGELATRGSRAPFGIDLGITIGGLARGFSPAQVGRALDDVSDLLPAKPILSVALKSSGLTADSCNEGIAEWARARFGEPPGSTNKVPGAGMRLIEVHDSRPDQARPDEATLANLVEDTGGRLRWYLRPAAEKQADLAIIAQLETSQPTLAKTHERSAVAPGVLMRHRVRRQLPNAGQAFLIESRQAALPATSVEPVEEKLGALVCQLENSGDGCLGLRFAPDVHAIEDALVHDKAGFVAVSSAAVDPGCFVGDWLRGGYLWDYSLPSYAQRAGDTAGTYLISSISDVDREALSGVVSMLPGCESLQAAALDELLREVSRRGIPTVRELSGDDTKASGALGMFIAARVLHDHFRESGPGPGGLLRVRQPLEGAPCISVVVPVDPFRAHLEELARAVALSKDVGSKRPDLLVASFVIAPAQVCIRLVPVEVKLRSGGTFSIEDSKLALAQARALSSTLEGVRAHAAKHELWRLAFAHIVLAMVTFGVRVYSQNRVVAPDGREWASLQQALASALLGGTAAVEVDARGRLVVIDESGASGAFDRDGDNFAETIVVGKADAGSVMAGDPRPLYAAMQANLADWETLPRGCGSAGSVEPVHASSAVIAEASSGADAPAQSHPGADRDRDEEEQVVPGNTADSHADGAHAAAPEGIVLELGTKVGTFHPTPVRLNLSDTQLNQLNIGVVGDLGTGKTQLLKSLILQLTRSAEANRGIRPRFLIFDYKKDYSETSFVESVGAKVVIPHRMPLNLFDTHGMVDSPVPWLDRFKFFADLLDKIFSGIGPVQRDKMKQAVKRSYESASGQGRMPTIYDVHAEYRALLAGKSDAPLAIIDDLVDAEVFSKEAPSGSSFARFFDGVVVINLGAMGQDDRSKNMVVAIMLNMFYEHMLTIPKRPFIGKSPQLRAIDSYLLVDEADNIMQYEFDVLRKLLLQGREFGVGVVLASQYLRHFKVGATDYREPLLTWFVHKVPSVTPGELASLGLTADVGELADRVKSLPNHQCLYKSQGIAGEVIRGLPFFELKAS